MEDEGGGPGRHQQEHGLPPVPLAVDKHQAHIFEVAQGSGEELHERVGQAVAGQHFHGIFFDCGYAPVEGLEERWKRAMSRTTCDSDLRLTLSLTITAFYASAFYLPLYYIVKVNIAFSHIFYLLDSILQVNAAIKM